MRTKERESLHARLKRPVAFAAILSMAAACRPNPTPERVAAYQAAVARFERDSARWVHDSLVRDSISRTINTDSLYHLYHVMLVATEPVPIMSLLHCESFRLGWKYGIESSLAAEARMYDTLWTAAEHKIAREKDDHLIITTVQQMTLGVGPKRCGPLGPRRPDTVDGALTGAVNPKPVRPRKP